MTEPTNLHLARTLKHVYKVSGTVESIEHWIEKNPTMREQALQLHADLQDLLSGKRESIVTMDALHG